MQVLKVRIIIRETGYCPHLSLLTLPLVPAFGAGAAGVRSDLFWRGRIGAECATLEGRRTFQVICFRT